MRGQLEIAIVGAGPAGLAAALYLHRAGHRVIIFERFDEPKPVGSGLILQPTGLTVLHDLGLFEEIKSLGARIDRLHGADATTGRPVLDVRYDALKGQRQGIAVHRAALFGLLYRKVLAEGIEIATSQDVSGVDAEASGIRLTGAASTARFDLTIDASGAKSRLRSFAYHPVEPRPLTYGAFWASLDWRDGFDPNALLQRYHKASVMLGVLPIGRPEADQGPMAAFFWSLKPADADAVWARGLDAWKARVIAIWPECEAFTNQIKDFDQLSLARYGHHTLPLPAGRRLAVIGDAAHSASPQLGQGANMALLDAAALAFALREHADVADALDAYCSARKMHMRLFQMLSWMFTPFYQSDSTFLPFLRDRVVPIIAKIPPAPAFLASMVTGTVIDPFRKIGLNEVEWIG